MFDVFTTALNDNATRGQLSVNVGAGDPSPQAGLAAWSALFSGVEVLSNNAVDAAIPTNAIVHARSAAFHCISDQSRRAGGCRVRRWGKWWRASIKRAPILPMRTDWPAPSSTSAIFWPFPQLTWQSPFLNWNDGVQQVNGISDEMYEWLPQQVMSLLHVSDSPRYVIYSYGQTLKPAPNGISTGSGAFFGMVTNYQVVAEAATRAVVRFNGTRVDNVVVTNDGSS